jgi:polyisoprenoid-binding protein YceI
MTQMRTARGKVFAITLAGLLGLVAVIVWLTGGAASVAAQPQPQAAMTTQMEFTQGTRATYRVREQLVGLSFPDDAVGGTDSINGKLVLRPDGSIDGDQSKLTVDLRTLKSDQDMRDGYVRNQTFDTDKYPLAEFVPRRIEGIPSPLPTTGQVGFKLTGDMTIRGVTSEVAWMGYATFKDNEMAGRARTDFTFATFKLNKPQLWRLLSVDDKIQLEIEFRMKKSN